MTHIPNVRHSRASGNPVSWGKRHWVPAEACPRMLESGAGTTTVIRHSRASGKTRPKAEVSKNGHPVSCGKRHRVPAEACPRMLESGAGTTDRETSFAT